MNQEAIFKNACELQARTNPQQSPYNQQCNRVIFDVFCRTMNIKCGQSGGQAVQVISSGTGTGKTTFCAAPIAALANQNPDYSAAVAVATVEEA